MRSEMSRNSQGLSYLHAQNFRPYEDMEEARKVWERARDAVAEGRYDELPKESQSYVSHVRPHGRDSSDTIEGPDGKQHVKKCFWLNRDYITGIARRLMRP